MHRTTQKTPDRDLAGQWSGPEEEDASRSPLHASNPASGGRRRFRLRTLGCALLIIVMTVLSTGEAFGAAKGTSRPIKGSGTGAGYITIANGVIKVTIDGTQQLSHLGRSTFHLDTTCTNADCSAYDATTVFTAANGDTFTTFARVSPGTTGFTENIIGGTGRFSGATGTMTETGTLTPDPSNPLAFTSTFKITGRISY